MAAFETILHGAWIDYSPQGGASYGGGGTIAGSALATLEANLGRQLSFVNYNTGNWMSAGTYQSFDGASGGSDRRTNLDKIVNAGRLPMSPWSNWDQSTPTNNYLIRLAAIANGDHDGYITAFATAAKAWGAPLLLRFGWEQNLIGQFPWQHGPLGSGVDQSAYWGGTAWSNSYTDYINAWQHIVGIFRSIGANNVKFVWCPNVLGTTDTVTLAQMFPGYDANGRPWVDWMGLDGYSYSPNMTLAQNMHGTPAFPGGSNIGRQDSYALMAALDPSLPMMICETGVAGVGTGISSVAITGITTSAGVWTVTTAAAPATSTNHPNAGWAAGQGVDINGVSPSGYNGQWQITAGIDATHFTVTNAFATAYVSGGTANLIDRASRAVVYQALPGHLAAMPRIKALCWFWTTYSADHWTPDYIGNQPNNPDMLALRHALGDGRLLSGGQMGTAVTARTWDPFQDQAMPGGITGAVPRQVAVAHSITGVLQPAGTALGLVGEWLMNDSAAPVLDSSGNGFNGTITGTVTLGSTMTVGSTPPGGLVWRGAWAALTTYAIADVVSFGGANWWCILGITGNAGNTSPVVDTTHWTQIANPPSEPGWTCASFPGSGAGNFITVPDQTLFSISNTGQWMLETSFMLPSAPAARSCLVGKGTSGSLEFEVWVSATQYGCTLHQLGGTVYADYPHSLPALGVWHHVVFTVNTAVPAGPLIGYLDAAAGLASGAAIGSLGNGTAPLTFGQLADGTLPLTPAGSKIGATRIWNVAGNAETAGALYAAWRSKPLPTSVVASVLA